MWTDSYMSATSEVLWCTNQVSNYATMTGRVREATREAGIESRWSAGFSNPRGERHRGVKVDSGGNLHVAVRKFTTFG